MKFTNKKNVPLPLAVWLAVHEYDSHDEIPNYYSASTLCKSTQQIVLGERAYKAARYDPQVRKMLTPDVADKYKSHKGTSVHDSIENVWTNPELRDLGLKLLDYDNADIKAVEINPEPSKVTDDVIPVYVELRKFKKLGKYTIGGKFDIVIENTLFDHKNTSVFTYLFDSMREDYITQMSIYRWLNPELELEDTCHINMIFDDWKKAQAGQKSDKWINDYPENSIVDYKIQLMSVEDTEKYLVNKLKEIEKGRASKNAEVPRCENVWQNESVYKYFTNAKNTKATKTSKNIEELQVLKARNGKGVIVFEQGKVKRCNPKFCAGYTQCKQKDEYLADGLIDVDWEK